MSKTTELEEKAKLDPAASLVKAKGWQAKGEDLQESQEIALDLSTTTLSESISAKMPHDGEELEGAFKDALDKFGSKIGKAIKKVEIIITEIAGKLQLIVNSEGMKVIFSTIEDATIAILELINSGKLTSFLETLEEVGGPVAHIASDIKKHEDKIAEIARDVNSKSRKIDKVIHSELVDGLSETLAQQNYAGAAAILVKSGTISQKMLLTQAGSQATVINSALYQPAELDHTAHKVALSGHMDDHN